MKIVAAALTLLCITGAARAQNYEVGTAIDNAIPGEMYDARARNAARAAAPFEPDIPSAPPARPYTDYEAMDGKVFIVDGAELAARSAKVKVKGTYAVEGDNSYLWVAGTFTDPVKIGLLTDGAPRAVRLRFLDCRSKPIWYTVTGCQGVTIVGTATTCDLTTLIGSRSEPCIEVKDAGFDNHGP